MSGLLVIIILLGMSEGRGMNEGRGASGSKYSKYDDWVCLMCQNHNYSFRTVCTSCPS